MRDSLLSYLYDNELRDTDIAFSYRRKLRYSHWTYAQFARTVYQFARELEDRGFQKGDHLVIWSENCPEWIGAFYGSLLLGVIVVPIDEQCAVEFLERVCERTRPKLVIRGTRNESIEAKCDIMIAADLPKTISRHSTERFPAKNVTRNDPVEIVFTSGTTASPKGVVLTHENILANIEAIERAAQRYLKWEFLVHPIRILCLLPLSHVFGQLMGMFIPPLLRAEVILQNQLNPSEIVETIKRERISVLATVPRILTTLQSRIERDPSAAGEFGDFRRKLSDAEGWGVSRKWWNFRTIHSSFGWKFWAFVSGGASLSRDTEDFWSRLGYAVVQGYGMTETSALVSLNNPFKPRRGSIGEVLAGQEVRIDDTGEILVRGKNVSPSSIQQAESGSPENGWLRTGDLGFVDDSGRLYFRGRKKDVIVTAAGLNIYPEDIEIELNRQPELKESIVVGLRGENGEEPVAALIVKPGGSADNAVYRANRSLAPHQQIRRWVVWPEPDFPRSATMKVRKNIVADNVRQMLSMGGKGESKVSALGETLSRIRGRASDEVTAHSRLTEDLGLDSLARVELMSAIEERYHVDLNEQAFSTVETVADLEQMIIDEGLSPAKTRLRIEFPRWPLSLPARYLRMSFYYLVILPLTLILCRVKVRGLDNLTALESRVLFASNHVTEIDAALIMSALPNRFRKRLAIAMDGEKLMGYRYPPEDVGLITKIRLFLQYLLVVELFNVFPLPRMGGFRKSFEYAGWAMDQGFNILIFPEGQLTKDGRLQELRPGVGLLADGLETTTVPVKISGLYEQKQAGHRFHVRPGSVTITFGRPLFYSKEKDAQLFIGEMRSSLEE